MVALLKKNEKGLTLIELLAVLVIIGIIAAIAIPAIGGTIEKSKDRADQASDEMVIEAAIRYATDQSAEGNIAGDVSLTDLVSKGYLLKTPAWKTKKDATGVKIAIDNNGGTTVTVVRPD